MNEDWSAQEWINRGGEQLEAHPSRAQRMIGRGLMLEPHAAVGWFNLGIGLHQRRRISAAIRAYQHCLDLPHDHATGIAARNNLSQDLLLSNRWQEGWMHYANRFQRRPSNYQIFEQVFGSMHQGPIPRDRPLLLMSEQGLGDTLQFSRYALVLQNSGFDVTLLSQPPLVPLLKEAVGLQQVVEHFSIEDQLQRNPIWMPLMDLAPRIGCLGEAIPMQSRFLEPDPARVATWKRLLQQQPDRLLVALHWQGNPGHENSLYSRGRSMAFETFLRLQGIKEVEFVSIQKGPGSEQLRIDCGLPFVAGQMAVSESMDFRDTTAVLANCDLLISADSCVVHLGGAMALPTWVALRWIPEWRWGLNGSTSHWYESLRLFRQPRDGDWASVMDSMRSALARLRKRRFTHQF